MYREKEQCCCYSKNKIKVNKFEIDKFEDDGFAMKKDTFYLNSKPPIIVSNSHNIRRQYKRKSIHNSLKSIYKYTHKQITVYKKKDEKRKSFWSWLCCKKKKHTNP